MVTLFLPPLSGSRAPRCRRHDPVRRSHLEGCGLRGARRGGRPDPPARRERRGAASPPPRPQGLHLCARLVARGVGGDPCVRLGRPNDALLDPPTQAPPWALGGGGRGRPRMRGHPVPKREALGLQAPRGVGGGDRRRGLLSAAVGRPLRPPARGPARPPGPVAVVPGTPRGPHGDGRGGRLDQALGPRAVAAKQLPRRGAAPRARPPRAGPGRDGLAHAAHELPPMGARGGVGQHRLAAGGQVDVLRRRQRAHLRTRQHGARAHGPRAAPPARAAPIQGRAPAVGDAVHEPAWPASHLLLGPLPANGRRPSGRRGCHRRRGCGRRRRRPPPKHRRGGDF
mmetsp:Transcript_28592/g.68140  ORF Transcript_28592/g.68140 Transcript_28592/m.68140 type:complete len:340 (-) Transcript_28592:2205-3224(-)